MDGAYGMHRREQKYTQNYEGKPERKIPHKNLCINTSMISKLVLKTCSWSGLNVSGKLQGQAVNYCKHDNKISNSPQNTGVFLLKRRNNSLHKMRPSTWT
jgi:hypothetical protein